MDEFATNLENINMEWNQTKEHQQMALTQFKNLQKA